MKNVAILCTVAGIVALGIAVGVRLLNLQPLLNNPVSGLWKASTALLLAAIAIGVNKQ